MRYVLIPLTLPMFIFGYLYVAFFTLLGATRQHRFDPKMWTWECIWAPWVVKQRTWLSKWPFGRKSTNDEGKPTGNLWKYGTTFAYGIIYAPGAIPEDDTTEADTRHERHEDVHVRQGQDENVLGFLVGLAVAIGMWVHADAATGFIWWGAIWMSSVIWRLPNMLTAVLRGGHVYRDAEHERSAYAQTDYHPGGKSWLEKHLEKDRSF